MFGGGGGKKEARNNKGGGLGMWEETRSLKVVDYEKL